MATDCKTPHVIPFETFDRSKGKWSNWVKRLEVTFDLFKVTEGENRKKMLLYHMGMEAFDVLSEMADPREATSLTYEEIIHRLKQYYDVEGIPKPTEAQLCWRFWQRRQMLGESVFDFLEALKELVKPCKFSCQSCESRIVRNQFVSGLRDPLIRKTLLQEPELTVEKAWQIAKKMENERETLTTGGAMGISNLTEEGILKDLITKNCFQCQHPVVQNPGNWHLIHLRNINIADWSKMMQFLKDHGATGLEISALQQMSKNKWKTFSTHINVLDQLEVIITRDCNSITVTRILENCSTRIKIFNAYSIGNEPCGQFLDISAIHRLENLEELRLKTESQCQRIKDLTPLTKLKNLKHLALVFFGDLAIAKVQALGELTNLVSLELGECRDLPDSIYYDLLAKLKCLKRLRIVHALSNPTAILDAVAQKAPTLKELELINVNLKAGFSEAIARCSNLKTLLLAPTYTPYHEPINVNIILTGVSQLSASLEVFNWVILDEIVKVADDLAAKGNSGINTSGHIKGQSLAVSKPAWFAADDRSQAAIRPLTEITNIFKTCMPKTFLHIARIPFKDTWTINVVRPMKGTTFPAGKKVPARKEP